MVPSAPSGRLGGVAGPLGLVWSPWGLYSFTGSRLAAIGTWPVPWALSGHRGGFTRLLGPVWPPSGRGRLTGPRLPAMGAWPFPLVPSGLLRGVDGPLSPVWSPGGFIGLQVLVWLPSGRGRSPGPCLAAIGALPVPWALSGKRAGVA